MLAWCQRRAPGSTSPAGQGWYLPWGRPSLRDLVFKGSRSLTECLPKGHDFSWNKITSGIQPAAGCPPYRHVSEQQ